MTEFSWERIGDDLVLFDGETMQYHTLNAVAERIWRACDGVVTIESIALSTGLPVEVVETTVAELGEASLLQTPASAWSIPMNRRRAAKLIAAGAVGAVGVPVVLSITAPSHQAAASPLPNCKLISGFGPGWPCDGGIGACDYEGWDTYYCCPSGSSMAGKWWDVC